MFQYQIRIPKSGDALTLSEFEETRPGFSFALLGTHTMKDFMEMLEDTLKTEYNMDWDQEKYMLVDGSWQKEIPTQDLSSRIE